MHGVSLDDDAAWLCSIARESCLLAIAGGFTERTQIELHILRGISAAFVLSGRVDRERAEACLIRLRLTALPRPAPTIWPPLLREAG